MTPVNNNSFNFSFSALANTTYGPITQGVGVCIVGIIASVAVPLFAVPLFSVAGSLTITGLVMKISDHYHIEIIDQLKLKATCIQIKHPKLQAITLVFFLFVTPFIPKVGCIIGVGVGVCTGLLIGIEHIKALQRKKRAEMNQAASGAATTITGF